MHKSGLTVQSRDMQLDPCNMDPETMKAAFEAMSKMTPSQMATIQEKLGSIPPSVLQEQVRMFEMLSPDQKRAAAEQAKDIDPATMAFQASQFAKSTEWTTLRTAEELKAEGNKQHGLGNFAAAAEKYELAKSNVQGLGIAAAKTLHKACQLNLSSCYLQMGRFQQCIDTCSEVLCGDTQNLKARYRRGQALLAQHKYDAAIEDLRAAGQLAPPDQRAAIQDKLDKAQTASQIAATDLNGQTLNSTNSSRPERQESEAVLQEDDTEATDGLSVPTLLSSEPARPTAQPPLPEPRAAAAHMRNFSQMMRGNPELMRNLQDMAARMPNEAMMAGMGASPEMTSQAMRQLESMTPEQLESMAHMVESNPGIIQHSMTAASSARASHQDNSDLAAANAGGSNESYAEGSNESSYPSPGQGIAALMNPDLMTQAMNMMKAMPPDQLQAMGASLQRGSGCLPAMGETQPDQVQALLQDPGMMKAMQGMMSNMSPKDLAAMSQQAGLSLSEAQAEVMAGQLKKLTPEQLALLMRTANSLQRAKSFLLSRSALFVAVLILTVALLWKYLL